MVLGHTSSRLQMIFSSGMFFGQNLSTFYIGSLLSGRVVSTHTPFLDVINYLSFQSAPVLDLDRSTRPFLY